MRKRRNSAIGFSFASGTVAASLLPLGVGLGGAGHGTWTVYYTGLCLAAVSIATGLVAVLFHALILRGRSSS